MALTYSRKRVPPEAVCPLSQTGLHFHAMTTVMPYPAVYRTTCDRCDRPLKVAGAYWVVDEYTIRETVDIDDLL